MSQATVATVVLYAAFCLPIVVLIAAQRRIGAVNAASGLVVYGVLVMLYEHAGFTFTYTRLDHRHRLLLLIRPEPPKLGVSQPKKTT
jgi:hypothetical protein